MKWTEPWYSAYAIVGMMVLGVAPILIPLTVEDGGKNGATAVGLVVAAFYAGGLLAPVLGSLADTHGWQRRVFLWLIPVMAVTTTAFAFVDQVWMWAALAFVFGGSGSLSGTVAGLFVVESKPQSEWNERLSWFRLFYGAGQVIGLLIAAITASMLQAGWIVTALLLALGFFLGRLKLPKLTPTRESTPHTVPFRRHRPVTGARANTRARAIEHTALLHLLGHVAIRDDRRANTVQCGAACHA